MVLGLWIPLVLTQNLVRERLQRKNSVIQEIASAWGAGQTLIGPIASFRYSCSGPAPNAPPELSCKNQPSHRLQHMPVVAGWSADLDPGVRRRGIYEAVVWQGAIHFEGRYRPPPAEIRRDGLIYRLTAGQIVLGLSDHVGLLDGSRARLGEHDLTLLIGDGWIDLPQAGLHASLPLGWLDENVTASRNSDLTLSLGLEVRGTERLRFTPGAASTSVTMKSTWPSPGFSGARLPTQRRVEAAGFEASWQIAGDSHSTPDQWWDDNHSPANSLSYAFGVDLVNPVDGYQLTTRATKYGLLFLVLTFTTFFLLEVSGPQRLHPIQYLLVGAALCVFYLLLLSLTEQIGFGPSYLLASIATVGMISLYALGISQNRTWFGAVGGGLSALYGYLYVLLALEDFALLMGSIGLFAVLAAIMWFTRRLDWYAPRASPNPEAA
jgi:inner membrane protein